MRRFPKLSTLAVVLALVWLLPAEAGAQVLVLDDFEAYVDGGPGDELGSTWRASGALSVSVEGEVPLFGAQSLAIHFDGSSTSGEVLFDLEDLRTTDEQVGTYHQARAGNPDTVSLVMELVDGDGRVLDDRHIGTLAALAITGGNPYIPLRDSPLTMMRLRATGPVGATADWYVDDVFAYRGGPRRIEDLTRRGATVDGVIEEGEYGDASGGINSGYGDVIGAGSLLFVESDVEGFVQFGLRTGGGAVNDIVVMYIDSVDGGYDATDGFTDVSDRHRAAISGYAGGPHNTLDFNSRFEADYALAFDQGDPSDPFDEDFAGLWRLVAGDAHEFVATITMSPQDRRDAREFEWELALADIGLSAGDSFRYVVTYATPTGYRSDEFHGVSSRVVPAGNLEPGDTSYLSLLTNELLTVAPDAVDLSGAEIEDAGYPPDVGVFDLDAGAHDLDAAAGDPDLGPVPDVVVDSGSSDDPDAVSVTDAVFDPDLDLGSGPYTDADVEVPGDTAPDGAAVEDVPSSDAPGEDAASEDAASEDAASDAAPDEDSGARPDRARDLVVVVDEGARVGASDGDGSGGCGCGAVLRSGEPGGAELFALALGAALLGWRRRRGLGERPNPGARRSTRR